MADRPIIFSAPMILALLAGRKTQTRRIIKPQPGTGAKGCYHRPDGLWIWTHLHRPGNGVGDGVGISDPFAIRFKAGDRLWVRENFSRHLYDDGCWYWADGNVADRDSERIRPSIHMPRWASRLTLIVEGVKVERLQDISEEDAEAEGVANGLHDWDCRTPFFPDPAGYCVSGCGSSSYQEVFQRLWTSINGPDAWDANPWVVALTFTVHRANIDAIRADGLVQPLLVR